jgi:hypothetical protein
LWRTLPELVSLAAGVGGSAAEYRAFAERFSIEAQIESLGRILSSRIA